MFLDQLSRAWCAIVLLTIGSGVLAWGADAGFSAPWAGAAILALATQKARVILADYLGLSAAPFWRRGFDWALGGFALLLLGLYLLPSLI